MYEELFDGAMQVRLTASNGTIANASAVVKVGTYVEPVSPAPPVNLEVNVLETVDKVSSVQFSWEAADDLAKSWVVAVNGVPLGTLEGDRTTLEITDVIRSEDTELSVAGMMEDGTLGDYSSMTLEKEKETSLPPDSSPDHYSHWLLKLLKAFYKLVLGMSGDFR